MFDNLRYNVTITATDGTNTNNTQLIVFVEDVNDNSPVFSDTSCPMPVIVQEVSTLTLCIVSSDVTLLIIAYQ